MQGIRILATGSYLPPNPVKNEAFAAFLETSDEWIRTRTGIQSRNIVNGDNTWSMGAKAAAKAIARAGIDPTEIDMIVVSTITPDYATPSTACLIQQEIGATGAFALDIGAACTGFVYALDLARRYLCCGDVRTVLVVSSETMSRITDFTDRSSCVLFGDGAGACVVQAADLPYASALHSDGTGYHLVFSKNPPPKSPFTDRLPDPDRINQTDVPAYSVYQNGREVYKFATQALPNMVREACRKAGIEPAQLKYIIPHQANARIVETGMKNLGLPLERAWITIDHVGNTSSASIPIALDELVHSGKLERGDMLCVVGFGAGLTYGAAVFAFEG